MATLNMPGSMFAAALGLLSSCVALDLSSLSSCVCASGPQLSRTLNFIHCSHVTEGQSLDHPDRRLSRLETRLDCEIPVQTSNMAMGQNAWNPLVNTEIAGEWMFIPPKYGIKVLDRNHINGLTLISLSTGSHGIKTSYSKQLSLLHFGSNRIILGSTRYCKPHAKLDKLATSQIHGLYCLDAWTPIQQHAHVAPPAIECPNPWLQVTKTRRPGIVSIECIKSGLASGITSPTKSCSISMRFPHSLATAQLAMFGPT